MGNKRGPHGGRSGATGLDPLQVRALPALGKAPLPPGAFPRAPSCKWNPPTPYKPCSLCLAGQGGHSGWPVPHNEIREWHKSACPGRAPTPAGTPAGHRPTRRFCHCCHCAFLPKGRPHCPPQAGFPPTLSAGAAPRHSLRPGSEGDARARPASRAHQSSSRGITSPHSADAHGRPPALGEGRCHLKGQAPFPIPAPRWTSQLSGWVGVGPGVAADGSRIPADPSAPDPIVLSCFCQPPSSCAILSDPSPPHRGMDLQVPLSAEPPTPSPVPVSGLPLLGGQHPSSPLSLAFPVSLVQGLQAAWELWARPGGCPQVWILIWCHYQPSSWGRRAIMTSSWLRTQKNGGTYSNPAAWSV